MQIKINLCPKEILQKEKAKKIGILATLIGVVAALILGGIYLQRLAQLKRLEAEAEKVAAELAKLNAVVTQVEALESQKSQLKQKLDIIKSLTSESLVYPKFVDDLASRIPPRIWINDFSPARSADGFRMSISATSLDIFSIAEFITILDKSGVYYNVEFGGFTVSGEAGAKGARQYSFSMSYDYRIPSQ